MRRLATATILAALLLLAPRASEAWNRPGHMVTGVVAYEELRGSDPAALAEIVRILRTHPDHAGMWRRAMDSIGVKPSARDLFLFTYAARWPDDIRNNPRRHHRDWHFINHPYKPANQPGSVQARPPLAENIVRAFEENRKILLDPAAADSTKAVALCWIFHLTGDVHQPLHAAALFTTAYNDDDGDQGGNQVFVRAPSSGQAVNLHGFWDGLVVSSDRFQTAVDRGRALRARKDLERGDFPELAAERDFEDWAQRESFDAAVRFAYLEGALRTSKTESGAKVLPQGYTSDSRTIAEKRAVLAGYRLADLLAARF